MLLLHLHVSAVSSQRNPDLQSSLLQADLVSSLCDLRLTQNLVVHSEPHASVPERPVN